MGSAGSKARQLPKTLVKDSPSISVNKTSIPRGQAPDAAESSVHETGGPNYYEKLTENKQQQTPAPGIDSNMSERPDGGDPQESQAFADRLRQLGEVKFHDIGLNFSKENSMLNAVNRRNELEADYEKAVESGSVQEFISPVEVRQILQSLKRGESVDEIMAKFHIKPSVLENLNELKLTSDLVKADKEGKVTMKPQ